MANLFYRDVRQVFSVVIQLWMFVSAVVVPLPREDSYWAEVFALNPLVPIITAYRDCILNGHGPEGGALIYASVVALLLLIFGWIGFRRASFRFAECI
jgi:ABC-type polysaccharide/polyol phosphate export permease